MSESGLAILYPGAIRSAQQPWSVSARGTPTCPSRRERTHIVGTRVVDVASRTDGVHEDTFLLVVEGEEDAESTDPQPIRAALACQWPNVFRRWDFREPFDGLSRDADRWARLIC